MRKTAVAILLSLLAGLSAAPAFGQAGRGRAILMGLVTDVGGRPIAGAKITLRLLYTWKLGTRGGGNLAMPQTGSAVFSVKTDKKGGWRLPGLEPGQWSIEAEAEGYYPAARNAEARWISDPAFIIGLRMEKIGQVPSADASENALLEEANAAFHRRDYAKALEFYRRFRDVRPDDEMAALSVAECLREAGRLDDAAVEYRGVADRTAMNPRDAFITGLAWAGLAECHWKKREAGEAEKLFRLALAVGGESAVWSYNLAELLFARGALAEAVGEYGEAARIDPGWPDPLYKQGLASLKLGDAGRAAGAFRLFLDREPRSGRADLVRDKLRELEAPAHPPGPRSS